MKPLDDPVPSGDRTMGRLIVQALELGGHEVRVASRFRAWMKAGGDATILTRETEALSEADRITREWEAEGYRPDVFLTYHLYHKAPDWIGPALAGRFNLPYAIIEASRAPKRQTGPWALGFRAADEALTRADVVGALHHADAECLSAVLQRDRLKILPPFLDTLPFETAADLVIKHHKAPKLLAAGMMREGDKTRSYEVLADALSRCMDLDWSLTVIGDGSNRAYVESLFPPERTSFLGALPPEQMPGHYAAHDLFVWPAIREAFGFVFLEAQASGLGVVAGSTFGVPDIVQDGKTGLLAPEGDAEAFAAHLRTLIPDPERIKLLGGEATRHIRFRHTLEMGTARLNAFLETALDNRWQRSTAPRRPHQSSGQSL